MASSDDATLYLWAGILLGGIGLVAHYTGTLSGDWLLFGGILAIVSGVLFWWVKGKQLAALRDHLSGLHGGGLDATQETHDLWTDLQDWAEQEPRSMELVWDPQHTDVTTLALPFDDPVVYLKSILTPIRDSNEEMHYVVEMQTGHVIHDMHNDEEYDYDKENPFATVPFVQQHRFEAMLDIMERREVKRQLRKLSSGKLPGGYGTPADGDIEEKLEELQAEAGETEADTDADLDE